MLRLYRDGANLCTLLGLFAGFAALVLIASGQVWSALLAILTGAVADIFDGPLARSATSRPEGAGPFGQEFDTLADMCHSVLAPGLWIAMVQDFSVIGTACGLLLTAAGATRLAYFTTVKPGRSGYFIGVPVTYVPIALGACALVFGSGGSAFKWSLLSIALSGVQTGSFLFPKFAGGKFKIFATVVIALWGLTAIKVIMGI